MMRPRLCWLRRSCAILFALQLILTAPLVAAESEAPPEYPNHRQLRVWRDAAGEHPVETPADWAKRRAHILEGQLIAISSLDEVIAICRQAPSRAGNRLVGASSYRRPSPP